MSGIEFKFRFFSFVNVIVIFKFENQEKRLVTHSSTVIFFHGLVALLLCLLSYCCQPKGGNFYSVCSSNHVC